MDKNKPMTATEYISTAPVERQAALTALHEALLANDPTVMPVIKPMMGKEMILYEERGYMKYALASARNYMSLHCLPIYMNPSLRAKYAALLPAAKLQKGCINFTDLKEFPPTIFAALIAECSLISTATMIEKRKKNK